MFAVIKTGGKQYRVAAEDVITIERLAGTAGDTIAFEDVLLVNDGAATHVGTPRVAGATVAGSIVEQARGDKVISFKKRRRQNSRRKKGHRQDLTVVRITEILTGGAKPVMTKAAPVAATAAPAAASAGMATSAAAAVGVAAVAATAASATTTAASAATSGRDSSNLSLISGVGPTIEKKLRAAGIEKWEDIAAWTEADVERLDKELALRGRAKREEWVEQARELLAGKPPRAKVDQAEQKSGQDW